MISQRGKIINGELFKFNFRTWNLLNSCKVHLTSPSFVIRLFLRRQRLTDFLFRKCFRWMSWRLLYSPGLYSVKNGSDRSKSMVIPGTSWNELCTYWSIYKCLLNIITGKSRQFWVIVNRSDYLFARLGSLIASFGMAMNGTCRQPLLLIFNIMRVIWWRFILHLQNFVKVKFNVINVNSLYNYQLTCRNCQECLNTALLHNLFR